MYYVPYHNVLFVSKTGNKSFHSGSKEIKFEMICLLVVVINF